MNCPNLWIVVPCYNEEKVLPITSGMFLHQLYEMVDLGLIRENSRILFVNDGSSDKTWQIICDLAQKDSHFAGICQSRNRGHQNAVLAGLMEAKGHCDITISIDCDGQDDIGAMTEMVKKFVGGAEIVYGVRSSRETDTWFKRNSAQAFYRLLNFLGAEVVYNHADYRLVSNRVLEAFSEFEEVNLFLRGMFPLVGFSSATVPYERHSRLAGESHYPLARMLALAFDGITSLSIKPLRIIFSMGMVVALLSFIGCIWAVIRALTGNTVPGWASMTCIICMLSGIQLIGLGVVGEYVGKIYLESKHRPRYIISERVGIEQLTQAGASGKKEERRGEDEV